MIIPHRQDHIYFLCLLCTGLMLITSICNITYIVRSSLGRTDRGSVGTVTTANLTDALDNERDAFEETYQTFLHSFVHAYLSTTPENRSLPGDYCPPVPPDLQGPLVIGDVPSDFSIATESSSHVRVQHGGTFRPTECRPRHKVAIIVPYRNRLEILQHFLYHTHDILQRQQLDYRIYVCEQAWEKTFNKGIVMNGCFKEILRLQPDTPCFIMHDVDLLAMDDRNMYTCPGFPRHLSVAIDKFQFNLPYTQLVGGVLAMRREHYRLVNGYSTNYWGWGGEDDDMYARIMNKNLKLLRPPASIARYKMLKHTHQTLNPARMKFLHAAHTRIDSDGVNNVKYRLLNSTLYHLYTHLLIDVGEQPAAER